MDWTSIERKTEILLEMTSGGGHYSNEDKIDTIATTKGGGGDSCEEVHEVKDT